MPGEVVSRFFHGQDVTYLIDEGRPDIRHLRDDEAVFSNQLFLTAVTVPRGYVLLEPLKKQMTSAFLYDKPLFVHTCEKVRLNRYSPYDVFSKTRDGYNLCAIAMFFPERLLHHSDRSFTQALKSTSGLVKPDAVLEYNQVMDSQDTLGPFTVCLARFIYEHSAQIVQQARDNFARY